MKPCTMLKISFITIIWLSQTMLVFGQQSVGSKKNSPVKKAPTFKEVEGLLVENTCMACHNTTKKIIGPPFVEISKRKYSNEKIYQLIHNPQPQNWPGYTVAMPPMPQVTKADALKIASWINSLNK